MEILQNLLKVPQPIRVELEFEPRSPKSESPHSISLPTLKHLLPKNKDLRVVHFSQGCAMLARNNQVLTTEDQEERVITCTKRIVGAGCVVGRSQDSWGQS